MRFLEGMDLSKCQKQQVLAQLRILRTRHSTASETNRLLKGDTGVVLEECATISGKPTRDHKEVSRPAGALDVSMKVCDRLPPVLSTDNLHRLRTPV